MTGVHAQVLGHLVRRGVQAATHEYDQQRFAEQLEAWENTHYKDVPTWGVDLVGVTIVLAALMICSIRYTLRGIISHLAMVESPQTTYLVEKPLFEKAKLSPDALAEDAVDSDVLVIKHKPLTSNIRSTMKHLKHRAGFRVRWRGLSLFLIYHIVFAWMNNTFMHIFAGSGMPFTQVDSLWVLVIPAAASVLTSVLLARYAMTWTHIVISEPSTKPWFRRVPSIKTWKKVAGPTALNAVAIQLAMFLPAVFFFTLGLNDIDALKSQGGRLLGTKILAVLGIGLVTYIGLVIPSEIALTRVQASMLPEDQESIVPFDRTFGGKVVPEVLGGSGVIGWLEAWKTFDGGARVRLLKLYAKIAAIMVALHAFWAIVIVAEAVLVLGPALQPLILATHAQVFGTPA